MLINALWISNGHLRIMQEEIEVWNIWLLIHGSHLVQSLDTSYCHNGFLGINFRLEGGSSQKSALIKVNRMWLQHYLYLINQRCIGPTFMTVFFCPCSLWLALIISLKYLAKYSSSNSHFHNYHRLIEWALKSVK